MPDTPSPTDARDRTSGAGRPRPGAAAPRARRELPVWSWRTLVRRIHLVSGLLAGIFLTLAGVTGSALVFRHELDALLHPELLRTAAAAERVPLDSVVAAVRAAYPAAEPLRVQLARTPEETHEVTLTGEDPLQVYVDPYRGTVLGARRESETLPNTLFKLHSSLLAGENGEKVMGASALLLLVLVGTGLVVWWPGIRCGVRRFCESCTVKRCRNLRRINFDLHRAVGIWSTAFLVLVAVTGASLVFHDAFMAGLNWVTRSEPRPAPPVLAPVAGAAPLPLEELVRRAEGVVPDGRTFYVTLPTSEGVPVTVRQKVPSELHPNGRNFIYLHPQTGEVRDVEAAERAPAGTRAYNVLYPLHIGRWGGLWSRLLYAVLGLSPLVLSVSGILMWWNRTGRRRLPLPVPARVRARRSARRADRPAAARIAVGKTPSTTAG